ncbi:MAG TPA: DUF5675 family protein [Rhizomicrobium sp.]|jgi:hypothetical protein
MHLIIERSSKMSNDEGTFGVLYLDDTLLAAFAVTCEQPWKNNAPGHSCIPAGQYDLLPYNSPKHGETVVFHNPALGIYGTPDRIPAGCKGRSLCEIHPANWPRQLEGCVAVGLVVADILPFGRGVTASDAVFRTLVARWGDRKGLTAEIRNV